MNMLYVVQSDLEKGSLSGVKNKILGQVHALTALGLNVFVAYYSGYKYIFFDSEGRIVREKKLIIKNIEFSLYLEEQGILKFCKDYSIEIVYIRYRLSRPKFISQLKQLKRNGLIVAIEFATWPYQGEREGGIVRKLAFELDKFYAVKLHKYVDFAVGIGENVEFIHNIPALNIKNAIDVKSVTLAKVNNTHENYVLTGVANLSLVQGYDRIIEGIYLYQRYKKQCKVIFNIVGAGAEEKKLKELVVKYHLQEQVIFHGFKTGCELDDIFDQTDIGIGGLAPHRFHFSNVYSLKIREYCSRGIPFLYSGNIGPEFERFYYSYSVVSSDDPVNISDVITFIEDCNIDVEKRAAIRSFAEENFSWTDQMRKVSEKIYKINKM